MNHTRTIVGVVATLMAAGAAVLIAAQPGDKKPDGAAPTAPPAMSPEVQAVMAAYEAAAKKGPQHALLNEFVGTWDAKVSMFMPGAPEPTVSMGTMENSLIHDGHYLHHEYKGDFEGQAFTGSGQWGYNNMSKRWEGTWLDSFSTAIYFSTGTFDGKKGEWTMSGEYDHPTGYRAKQREVITMQGKDAHKMVTFTTNKAGVEEKTMEIVYTRKVAAK